MSLKALADFYRTALSKGKEIITIDEEIKNACDYLAIQRVRYSDVFDFKINIQDEVLNNSILKLTIQPLVENSIYHGLKTKGSFGWINIEGYKDGNKVIIMVTDDGIGIPQEKIEQILDYKVDKSDKTSFGLGSVNERVKLYFGEEYGLKIKSQEGKGTEIVIETCTYTPLSLAYWHRFLSPVQKDESHWLRLNLLPL